MISLEEKKNILKTYLYPFHKNPSKSMRDFCKKTFSCIQSFYFCSSPENLNQLIVYELLSHGYQSWKYVTSYDLVESFLGNNEDNKEFLDKSSSLLVVYHFKSTMENRRLEDLLSHTISLRDLEGKLTIVLTEVDLPKVKTQYQSLNKKIVEMGVSEVEDDI